MSVTIEITGLSGMEAQFAGGRAVIEDELGAAMGQAVPLVVHTAQGHAPHKTGTLASEIVGESSAFAGGARGIITSGAPYSQWVENGRGPVVPIHARVLHFVVNGVEVFTKRSGPAAPRPFFYRSLTENEAAIRQLFQAAMQRIVSRLGGV